MTTHHETGTAATHHVLTLGAGYAGMAAAIQLAARSRQRDATERFLAAATGGDIRASIPPT
ncbi:hypothetical protein [Nonomuraea sp. B19D2]|uniref:hypothetical protein n=1 Tax=Nonomuraea sp. B19D2 TaxID=3159561 RepID=UPI0032DAA37E